MTNMETLKVQVDEKRAKEIRAVAMQVYGYKKGSISNAINTAIDEWLLRIKIKKKKEAMPNWGGLRGVLSDVKVTSVELQHATTKARLKG